MGCDASYGQCDRGSRGVRYDHSGFAPPISGLLADEVYGLGAGWDQVNAATQVGHRFTDSVIRSSDFDTNMSCCRYAAARRVLRVYYPRRSAAVRYRQTYSLAVPEDIGISGQINTLIRLISLVGLVQQMQR